MSSAGFSSCGIVYYGISKWVQMLFLVLAGKGPPTRYWISSLLSKEFSGGIVNSLSGIRISLLLPTCVLAGLFFIVTITPG